MATPVFLLLALVLQFGEQPEPIFTRTFTRNGKQVPVFRRVVNQQPRTGAISEWIEWTPAELQQAAYRRFVEQLAIPVYESETRAEQEAIQKRLVHDWIRRQLPPGAPVDKLEALLLEQGFTSSRRSAGMPVGTLILSAHEKIKTGFFDWNILFAVAVDVRFDDAHKVTDFQVRRAYFTYPHRGIFAD